jgi:hypothetical protein
MSNTYDGPERRKHERVETDEPATIVFPNGRTSIECRVLDKSEGGMLLKIDAFVRLPAEFTLLSGDPEVCSICRVAWRIGSRTGCEFLHQFVDDSPGRRHVLPVESTFDEQVIQSRLLKHPLIVS